MALPVRIAIVGSCVSRDPFAFVPTSWATPSSYLARQSFAGVGDAPLAYDETWYAGLNGFEQRCVVTDLTKGEAYWAFERNSDFLLVDYIDERFDLVEAAGTLVSKTGHLMQPGFKDRYDGRMMFHPRLAPETTERWKAGAKVFFDRALRTFAAERIILHEALWAPCFQAADGTTRPFDPPYSRLIEPNNRLLEDYFAITKALVPGISVLRVPDEAFFADPEHKWSKEPFHYIGRYYTAFLAGLQRITEAAR